MLLQAEGLSKRYGGVTALDQVSLSVGEGEVVGLIGENGAGKSTFIKILGGVIKPDQGRVMVDGKARVFQNPKQAEESGIGILYQERHLLENLTVEENIVLGRDPRRGPFHDRHATRATARRVLEQLGVNIPPDRLGSLLSNAEKQLIEIARVLAMDARLIVMDEPTSSLSGGETDRLLEVVLDLKRRGISVIYVSHRLNEVTSVADRVVGFRDGKNAGGLSKDEISAESMIKLMVGRDVMRPPRESASIGQVRLEVERLRTTKFPKEEVSFSVRGGEVLGVAGLVGSGRSEVMKTIFGIDKPLGGEVKVDGKPLPAGSPTDAILNGVLLAPEDRRNQGAILDESIQVNINLPSTPTQFGMIDEKSCHSRAEAQRKSLEIKCASVDALVSSMSGGNQQKVVLAKWLLLDAKCLIFDEPTCGIDVGTRFEIYSLIHDLAARGVAVILVSSDREEVLSQSDRVLVFNQGRIAGELQGKEITESALMSLAVGHG